MDEQPVTIAEEVTASLYRQLIRRGIIDLSDVEALCEGLSEGATDLVRSLFVEAEARPASEVAAIEARRGFRVVKGEGE